MNTVKVNKGNTRFIAHRGCSALEAENTCAAFVAAGNRSYFGIETDIHRTIDGNFIISHDGSTERMSGDAIDIESTAYKALRKVVYNDRDIGKERNDLRMPSLEEYISICRRYEKKCILELKSEYTRDEIAEIILRIEAFGYLDSVIFISFRYENLLLVRNIKPEQKCQYLFGPFTEEIYEMLVRDRIDADGHFNALTHDVIERLHSAGLEVNAWTVDDTAIAERLINDGADYITSNILEGI